MLTVLVGVQSLAPSARLCIYLFFVHDKIEHVKILITWPWEQLNWISHINVQNHLTFRNFYVFLGEHYSRHYPTDTWWFQTTLQLIRDKMYVNCFWSLVAQQNVRFSASPAGREEENIVQRSDFHGKNCTACIIVYVITLKSEKKLTVLRGKLP